MFTPPPLGGAMLAGSHRICDQHEALAVYFSLMSWCAHFSPAGNLVSTSLKASALRPFDYIPDRAWARAVSALHAEGWIVHRPDGVLRLVSWQERYPHWIDEHPLLAELASIRDSEYWSREHGPEVFARDGHRCRYCGADKDLSLDHVIPRIQGGDDEADNLVVACRSCNSRKGGRTVEQSGMRLLPVPDRSGNA